MNRQRAQEIEQATNEGVDRWLTRQTPIPPDTAPEETPNSGVLHGMPRRRLGQGIESAHVALPMAHQTVFTPGLAYTISRLFMWLWACFRFLGGNAFDSLIGRSTEARRAARLRRAFEAAGPS